MKKQELTLKVLGNKLTLKEFLRELRIENFDAVRVHVVGFDVDPPYEYCYFRVDDKEARYGEGFYIFDGYEKEYEEKPEHLFDLNSDVEFIGNNTLKIIKEDKLSGELCELEFLKFNKINLKDELIG